ncbi:MAG TPA: type I restriction enzyme HsdR N-terminal domain-containing protein [Geobacteraceae bacterium]|nr:type I restriction enzyme HsdR N-terminal domain-containing protein [Geobacteraceae bacterium]
MTKTKKPAYKPGMPFPAPADSLHEEGNWLWIPLRNEWRDVTNKPEEIVRQHFIRALVDLYSYNLDQMDQERRTQHGHKSPRADIVIWQSVADKAANRTPVLVVECKTETIQIQDRDYYQGESHMRLPNVREQIESRLTGTSPTMKNISKPSPLDLSFPLPELDDQRTLIAELMAARQTAAAKRAEAQTLRSTAWAAFETALFEAKA